jgi:hypothetical protein
MLGALSDLLRESEGEAKLKQPAVRHSALGKTRSLKKSCQLSAENDPQGIWSESEVCQLLEQ